MRTRALAALVLVLLCFALLCVHTAQLTERFASFAAAQQHTRTLTVAVTRGKIYARDGSLLVDRTSRLLAAAAPCGETRDLLRRALGEDGAERALQTRAPVLLPVREPVNGDAVRTFSVPVRYAADDLAVHLVGSLDAQGNGATGIERAFDRLLRLQGGSLAVRFSVNASGQVLAGLKKEIVDRGFSSRAGVALTIDREKQRIVETALANSSIRSGCAALLDTGTGEVLALASVPAFDRTGRSNSTEDAAFQNKALLSYAPGSVMKPLLAAFALEQGVSPEKCFTCRGQIRVGDTVFRCYGGRAHGRQTMGEALQHSCNVWFIRLLQTLDAGAYLAFCRSLGLGQPLALCENLQTEAGVLPTLGLLGSPGQRALFAFGQGRLLATPLQLLQCYHVLATGWLVRPTVLRGTLNAWGLLTPAPRQPSSRVLKEETVQTLRRLLTLGDASLPVALAGKTGTAQSGVWQDGREVCRTWFCGFFPAGNPHYVLVLLCEDGVSGRADCLPAAKEICKRLVGYAGNG